jgi:hypothetical protein
LVCASSPAGTDEPSRPFLPSLRDLNHFAVPPGVKTPSYSRPSLRDKTKLPQKNSGGLKLAQTTLSGLEQESQRDSGSKPKVARHELPWVNVVRNFFNPNGVAAFRRPTVTQPHWGCGDLLRATQGSSSLATLGWRTQSRWDWTRKISDVAAAGAAHTAALQSEAARN